MYWDVVEVKLGAGLRSVSPIQDGLAGRVRWPRRADRLRWRRCGYAVFRTSFHHCGAVAWPGGDRSGAGRNVMPRSPAGVLGSSRQSECGVTAEAIGRFRSAGAPSVVRRVLDARSPGGIGQTPTME